jgi:glutamate dehydrogenase
MTAPHAWLSDLERALVGAHGPADGGELLDRYRDAFPSSYHEEPAKVAVADIGSLELLYADDTRGVSSVTSVEAGGARLRCRLRGVGEPRLLSELVPIFAGFGLAVSEQRRLYVRPAGRRPGWVDEFDLVAGKAVADHAPEAFDDAFGVVWRGEAEADGFNALVLTAGLTWRQATVLRTYAKYLRQGGSTFSQDYIGQALAANVDAARLLVELFETQLDPARYAGDHEARRVAADRLADRVGAELERVASLDQDRILRSFLALVHATLRTNYFRSDQDGQPKPYMSFKLNPQAVPGLPAPRPKYEIWVYSPRVEGVHLRFGAVARGGLRWSDRREDFRTEILGLVKAQAVKNAVIVPVGAKGGFVCKQLPDPADREAWLAEGVACYKTFISGLLDITDNLVGGEVVPPPQVVRHDGDDSYLVVAADKGTATFSDIANSVSKEYGFWLGDAFASGGSAGYDHKAMGITARGAWESVKRHFREMGVDCQSEDFTVVGVGDMSGDVFGNGMLLSEHIRLVAAFDHRHIFLDPDPDAKASFGERQRLFALPRSSWSDYDQTLISRGGGVYPRLAKSVTVTPQVKKRLGIDGEVTTLTPTELIRAIIKAPVDLLWNGGIGTYVKAARENNADVGDKANDAVRMDADRLRCKVAGEGGNLGFTPLGRIEYARGGGRINTDAIDNSAGVDTSDHEVNIKVLLDPLVRSGELADARRNQLLAQTADDVAELVLANNYRQNLQLSVAEAHAEESLDRHATLIRFLGREGYLDRAQEFLPDDEGIAALQAAGAGLSRPELSVLLAHSKNSLRDDLDASDVPDDPHLVGELVAYFPTAISDRFRRNLSAHPLRREIIATSLVNDLVDHLGPGFVYRLEERTGAGTADAVRAYVVVRDVFGLAEIWSSLQRRAHELPPDAELLVLADTAGLLDHCSAWLIRHRRPPLELSTEISLFKGAVQALAQTLRDSLDSRSREDVETRTRVLVDAGVSPDVASATALLGPLAAALDLVELSRDLSREPAEAASVYFALGERLDLRTVRARISDVRVDSHWTSIAKAALLDDLAAQQRRLTASALSSVLPGAGADGAVSRWVEDNERSVARWGAVASDLRRSDPTRLAPIVVAVQTLRDMAAPAG